MQAPATQWQTSDTIIIASIALIVLSVIYAGIRYRPKLWIWLALLESFLLFWSFGNCFVPGPWKLFWETELPYLAITSLVAYFSSRLRVSAARRENPTTKMRIFTSPQMISLYCVLSIIAFIVVDHP